MGAVRGIGRGGAGRGGPGRDEDPGSLPRSTEDPDRVQADRVAGLKLVNRLNTRVPSGTCSGCSRWCVGDSCTGRYLNS